MRMQCECCCEVSTAGPSFMLTRSRQRSKHLQRQNCKESGRPWLAKSSYRSIRLNQETIFRSVAIRVESSRNRISLSLACRTHRRYRQPLYRDAQMRINSSTACDLSSGPMTTKSQTNARRDQILPVSAPDLPSQSCRIWYSSLG